MTPDQRAQALRDGEDAALALEKLPFDTVSQAIRDEWAKAEDYKTREDLWYEQKVVERVKKRLWSMIHTAKAAAIETKQDEQAQATKRTDPYAHA
jgi:hypothetical protein